MHGISIQILKKILQKCGVNEKDWSEGTGGVTDDKGWVVYSIHHYRPHIEGEGMAEHRDLGHVSVLYINQGGLQMQKDGKWIDVPPKENHFVINFGRTLELFVGNESQLVAVLHRVRHVSDRISFGVFTNNGKDTSLYGRSSTGELVNMGPYNDYISNLLKPTI